ncbi:hypothetical protein [Acidianus manzaensis]|uniref:Uncharacterized protein n=1 Tax=Acidianus manzaensis TaxID=282676 RepID=A0A1W6JYN0_9CREN|nr:hypothetical protein [Acidianus manzaensis]ARM75345.1 hypothetical protein B6F84_04400 [Acidianus manzaensis]
MEEGRLLDIIEPETQVPAMTLGLIRQEKRDGKNVIYYRPISPFTPPILVIAFGLMIKTKTNADEVILENYYLSNEINEILEEIKND